MSTTDASPPITNPIPKDVRLNAILVLADHGVVVQAERWERTLAEARRYTGITAVWLATNYLLETTLEMVRATESKPNGANGRSVSHPDVPREDSVDP